MAVEGYPAALALGAMLCLGLSDALNRRAMRAGVKRGQFLVVQSVFFTVTTLALMPLVGSLEWRPELLYAVACGAITFVSYVFVLRALEVGEATVAVPIYRMSLNKPTTHYGFGMQAPMAIPEPSSVLLAGVAVVVGFATLRRRLR